MKKLARNYTSNKKKETKKEQKTGKEILLYKTFIKEKIGLDSHVLGSDVCLNLKSAY